MIRLIHRSWLLAAVLICLLTVNAQAAPRATILNFGYYEFTGNSERVANPVTTTGFVTQGEARLVEQTRRIPVKKGRLFGFRFRLDNMNENVGRIPLELVVTHPEMRKPDGSKSSGYQYRMDLIVRDGVVEDKTGYRMNEPYELVEGEWTFEYRFMNKSLIRQTFTTYRP